MRCVDDVMRELDEYMRQEAEHGGIHPDGCYYCGGDHPTDCCLSEERDRFYEYEELR